MKNVRENANRCSIQVLTIRGDSRVTNVLQNTMKNEQCLQVGADPPNPQNQNKKLPLGIWFLPWIVFSNYTRPA
jgi:hypothetical protein